MVPGAYRHPVADADYCELCDLPLSTCVHGRPEPKPEPKPATPVRVKRAPARVPGTRATPAATRPPVARRWTQPAELRPAILAALQDDGRGLDGLEQDQVFALLEERIGEQLRPGDREPDPRGELRWHAAARKARKSLMDDGLLATAGPGVWQLTERGAGTTLPAFGTVEDADS